MKLVDAEKLLDDGIKVRGGIVEDHLLFIPMDDVIKSIKNAPAIDAVPVVRCFECKHSDNECHRDGLRYCMRGIKSDDYNETGYIYPIEEIVRDDDFCSYGELKEGAENG